MNKPISDLKACPNCGYILEPGHHCVALTAFTVWYRYSGRGFKKYYLKSFTQEEMKQYLVDLGYEDVLVWMGNWFGMAPDNKPEPDTTYQIPETEE